MSPPAAESAQVAADDARIAAVRIGAEADTILILCQHQALRSYLHVDPGRSVIGYLDFGRLRGLRDLSPVLQISWLRASSIGAAKIPLRLSPLLAASDLQLVEPGLLRRDQ